MFGYAFLIEDFSHVTEAYSYYLIKLIKSANFLEIFKENALLISFYFIIDLILILESIILILLPIIKILRKEMYKSIKNNLDKIVKLRDLYYRVFIWVLFVPLVDVNVNFILCNLKNNDVILGVCSNLFFKVFGILCLVLTFFQMIQIIIFCVNIDFEGSNPFKRNFRIAYIVEWILKVLVIFFYYLDPIHNIYYYVCLNIFGLVNIWNSLFGFPYNNMKICVLQMFFSFNFVILMLNTTFKNFIIIIGYAEICYSLTLLSPFLYSFANILFAKKFNSLMELNIHDHNLSTIQMMLYFKELIRIYKENSIKGKLILNGIFSAHFNNCFTKECMKHLKSEKKEFVEESSEIFEVWLLIIFKSLEKKIRFQDKYQHELFLLSYSGFLEKNLGKICFSYYVLKSHINNNKGNGESSIFFKYQSKLIQKHLENILTSVTKKKDIDMNFINIKVFISYQDISDKYSGKLKLALLSKENIFQKLLSGYKSFDELFLDSKNFLKILKKFEYKFLKDVSREKKSILYLKLKSLFFLFVLNDFVEFQKIENQILELKKFENGKKTFADSADFISGDLILLNASLLGETGTMRKSRTSQKIAEFFGYNINEFQNIKKINSLMPKILGDNHHLFIKKFLGKKHIPNKKTEVRSTFMKKNNNYMYPVYVYLSLNFSPLYKDDMYFTAAIKMQEKQEDYAICSENGNISCVSEGFLSNYMDLDWRSLYEKINIFFFFPNIFTQCIKILEDNNEKSIQILKNEVVEFYCPKNISIFKLYLIKESREITKDSLKKFIALNEGLFKKQHLLISVKIDKYFFSQDSSLKMLLFTFHQFEGRDTLSFPSKSAKSLDKDKNFEGISKLSLNEAINLEALSSQNSIYTERRPHFNPIEIFGKDPPKTEDFPESYHSENNYMEIDFNFKDRTNLESHETNKIKFPFVNKNRKSTEFSTEEKKELTSSLHSSLKEEVFQGMYLVRSLGYSKKSPKVIKKLLMVFLAQIMLFFFLNIVSFIMIENKVQSFIDYSHKFEIPDEIAISYAYIVATQNLLLQLESNYVTYEKELIRELIIELEGHSYFHLMELITTIKQPDFNTHFEEEININYFFENEKFVQTEKFREFLMGCNQLLRVQITHPSSFFKEIFDFFNNNFRKVIEICSNYSDFFLSKAISIKEEQSQFYLMMSLIGLFLSVTLIFINFPFLNEYFVILEKILVLLSQINENECEKILKTNRQFMEILDDPSQKFLAISLEKTVKTPLHQDLDEKVSQSKGNKIKSKKKILSKIINPKLSRKTLAFLNISLLIVILFFYLMVFTLKSEFVSKMELSIQINTYFSNYLESCNLLYSLELLILNINFFADHRTLNYTILEIENDAIFYKDKYEENILKLENFLRTLPYLTNNPEIVSIDSQMQKNIKEAFFNNVCDTMVEEACEIKLENNFLLGLNGFWQSYLKISFENLLQFLNFTADSLDFLTSAYTNKVFFEKLIDLHIFDHKNMDLIAYKENLQLEINNRLISDIKLIFLLGSAISTIVLFLINLFMFCKIKNTSLSFKKILFLVPIFKLKEENILYLLKKIDEY